MELCIFTYYLILSLNRSSTLHNLYIIKGRNNINNHLKYYFNLATEEPFLVHIVSIHAIRSSSWANDTFRPFCFGIVKITKSAHSVQYTVQSTKNRKFKIIETVPIILLGTCCKL
jgi:hypothetical protein